MIRVLVADDHDPTRDQIVKELAAGGVIQVVAEADTTDLTWKQAKEMVPDIVLLDSHMPGLLSVPDLSRRLTGLRNVKIVVYGAEGRAADVHDLLEAGAAGYLLKSDPPALVRMTILMVSRGAKNVISPSLPRHLTRLTVRERTILRHLTRRGKPSQIAERIGISEGDLTAAMEHLASKLELAGPAQLVRWAKKHGF